MSKSPRQCRMNTPTLVCAALLVQLLILVLLHSWISSSSDHYDWMRVETSTTQNARFSRDSSSREALEHARTLNASQPGLCLAEVKSAVVRTRPINRLKTLWRSLRLDWHNIVPSDGQLRGLSLTKAESVVLRTLIGVDGDEMGQLRGPLAKFEPCPFLADKCMIHDSIRGCVQDELCGWCATLELCVSRFVRFWPEKAAGSDQPVCPGDRLVVALPATSGNFSAVVSLNRNDATLQPVVTSEALDPLAVPFPGCSVIVTRVQPVQVILSALSRIAYHIYVDDLPRYGLDFDGRGLLKELATHVWSPSAQTEASAFSDVFQAASDSCLRPANDLPDGVSVCYPPIGASSPRPQVTDDAIPLTTWSLVSFSYQRNIAPAVTTVESVAEAVSKGGLRRGIEGLVRDGLDESHFKLGAPGDFNFWPNFLLSIFGFHRSVAAASTTALRGNKASGLQACLIHVVLVSRRNKRVLVNEPELVAAASAHYGIRLTVAALEDMPLYAQIELLQQTDVLIGVHGSALINSFYMRQGSVLVELAPFRVNADSFFDSKARNAGQHYLRWNNKHPERTFLHWHFTSKQRFPTDADRAGATDPKEASSLVGPGQGHGEDFFTFWINQDTVVDVDEWDELLTNAEALARGPPP